jgi:hypothetical protein
MQLVVIQYAFVSKLQHKTLEEHYISETNYYSYINPCELFSPSPGHAFSFFFQGLDIL